MNQGELRISTTGMSFAKVLQSSMFGVGRYVRKMRTIEKSKFCVLQLFAPTIPPYRLYCACTRLAQLFRACAISCLKSLIRAMGYTPHTFQMRSVVDSVRRFDPNVSATVLAEGPSQLARIHERSDEQGFAQHLQIERRFRVVFHHNPLG
jgi:hypothetical protein